MRPPIAFSSLPSMPRIRSERVMQVVLALKKVQTKMQST